MAKASDRKDDRVRLALELSPIVEVARSLGLRLQVVYGAECPCGGVLDIFPSLGNFVCVKCGRRGNAQALVQLLRGVSDEDALRYLEERAGLASDGSSSR